MVDRAALLQYLQYQAQAFEPDTFAARLDAMSPAERQQLVDDYVREEALYREALALGLAEGDYVMRRRLVQKMEFLLGSGPDIEPDDAMLRQYLADHAAVYAVAPSWTFTHVFVDPALHADAERTAGSLLARLRREKAGFNDAPAHSDRFPFLQNYVERTADYITEQFGASFTAALAGLPQGTWQGPLRSEHGWHLVLVTGHAPARQPAFEEIRERVRDDLRRDRARGLQEQAIRALVDDYQVERRDAGAPAP